LCGRIETNALVELDIDHAGDGIGAVLRSGRILEHFDPPDRTGGDHVQVHRVDAAGVLRVVGHERAVVAPLPVDQHQRIGRAQAPVADRADDREHAGIAAGEIHRGQDARQCLAKFGRAGGLELFGADNVDRRGAFRHRALRTAAHAGNDNRAASAVF